MAAGDFTINANTKTTNGRFHQVSGTAEIDGTKRAFNIFPSGYIVHFHVDPFDDSGSVTAEINLDTATLFSLQDCDRGVGQQNVAPDQTHSTCVQTTICTPGVSVRRVC